MPPGLHNQARPWQLLLRHTHMPFTGGGALSPVAHATGVPTDTCTPEWQESVQVHAAVETVDQPNTAPTCSQHALTA